MDDYNLPWRLINQKLRPQFDTKILEIRDANNNIMIQWMGFDGADGASKEKTKRAKLIVDAVNNYNKGSI